MKYLTFRAFVSASLDRETHKAAVDAEIKYQPTFGSTLAEAVFAASFKDASCKDASWPVGLLSLQAGQTGIPPTCNWVSVLHREHSAMKLASLIERC
jgi:hypothetical protein